MVLSLFNFGEPPVGKVQAVRGATESGIRNVEVTIE